MKFKILKNSKNNLSRLGEITTSHGKIATPVFMPCATKGSVKGISSEELQDIGFKIILGNTYHLYLRPGNQRIKKLGGLQKFINWPNAMLTDSGGYQVFSLGDNFRRYSNNTIRKPLTKITQKGVYFTSHIDGNKHLFTPEKVINVQLDLGSDIIMPLDFCPSANASYSEIKKAVKTTNDWFKRSFEEFLKKTKESKNRPAIFAIIQGGAYKDLRQASFRFLSQYPVDGFAIGGVANGGESKIKQKKAVQYTISLLPKDKPRYLMGVGEPEDIIYAVDKGIDMFDCVLPTRLGRHGTIWVTTNWKKFSKLDLRKAKYQDDRTIFMKDCKCPTCKLGYSKAYTHHLLKEKEMLPMKLASLHNLWLLNELVKKLRQKI